MPKLDYALGDGYGLSYSRLSTLHSCARLFQLENIINLSVRTESVTFSFGHVFGWGVQAYFRGESFDQAVCSCVHQWGLDDLWDKGTDKEQRANKSFWSALKAIELFYNQMGKQLSDIHKAFKGYELAYFVNDRGEKVDGIELTFGINLHSDYRYEGHIDAILYNKEKNEYLILELKTTAFTSIHEAQYQNSNQALSYSVVLDSIAGDLNANSSYHVVYLVYSTSNKEFTVFKFPKSIMQRANWLQGLMYDVAIIEMYRDTGLSFPTNGASCFNFFRPCRYLDTCTYTDESLAEIFKKPDKEEDQFAELEEPDFTFEFSDLIERQNKLMEDRIDLTTVEETGAEIDLDDLFE